MRTDRWCTQLHGHTAEVWSLAFTPDSRSQLSSSDDGTLRVWDVADGQCRRVMQGHAVALRDIDWSPDGSCVASGGDDTLYVWHVADGVLLQQLAGHHNTVTAIAWSLNGMRLATGNGSEGGGLFVWDVRRGERLHVLAEHPGIVYAIIWDDTPDLLITGGGDGVIRWWDIQRGACVRVREAHHGTVHALRKSPDGSKLASCGDDGAIMIWNLATGDHLTTLRRDRPYERMDVTGTRGVTEAQQATLRALGATEQRAFQPTPLIGRDTELAAIARLLADPTCRLLTLIGPSGIGKTHLAREVATQHTMTYTDGVAFISLASVKAPRQIVSALCDAFGLSVAGKPDTTVQLLTHLRDRHMLIVLDQFEHLLNGVDLVNTILAHASHITLLVTSRTRLNLQAEWLFDVEAFLYPPQDL